METAPRPLVFVRRIHDLELVDGAAAVLSRLVRARRFVVVYRARDRGGWEAEIAGVGFDGGPSLVELRKLIRIPIARACAELSTALRELAAENYPHPSAVAAELERAGVQVVDELPTLEGDIGRRVLTARRAYERIARELDRVNEEARATASDLLDAGHDAASIAALLGTENFAPWRPVMPDVERWQREKLRAEEQAKRAEREDRKQRAAARRLAREDAKASRSARSS